VKRLRLLRAACAALGLCASACYSHSWGPSPPEPQPARSAAHAPDAILRVNEAGVAWGDGAFGEAVQQALVSHRVFERVHYPVEPRDPPDWIVEVEALARFDRAETWSLLKTLSLAHVYSLGLFFFPDFEDYGIACEVRVRRGSQLVLEFQVEEESHLLYGPDTRRFEYLPPARNRVVQALVARIATTIGDADLGEPEATARR
jgi:hypothetical protein